MSGCVAKDVADRAEMVGEGPQNTVSLRVGEEFVLGVWRPEVMVRDCAIVDLNGGLVVFRDEDCLVFANDFTDPDVVVIVSVFDDLNGFPRLRFRIEGLFRYCS